MSKCHSCENGFNGRNGNGYMPCSCNKEAKPEFVPPPPLIPYGNTELKIIHPWFYRVGIHLVIGVVVGFVGCLYATSHIS